MIDNTALLDALVSIQDTPVEDRGDTGICDLVEEYVCSVYGDDVFDFMDAVHDELSELFTQWPENSGVRCFPVPGGRYGYLGLHKWRGDYGAARERLLEWLIERLKHDPENN